MGAVLGLCSAAQVNSTIIKIKNAFYEPLINFSGITKSSYWSPARVTGFSVEFVIKAEDNDRRFHGLLSADKRQYKQVVCEKYTPSLRTRNYRLNHYHSVTKTLISDAYIKRKQYWGHACCLSRSSITSKVHSHCFALCLFTQNLAT